MAALPKRRSSGRPVTGARYRIRPARAADVAAVAAIEREVFADPWSANDFQECVAGGVLFSEVVRDRKSTRLNSSHGYISYAVFCLKKKKRHQTRHVSVSALTSTFTNPSISA